jgi:hypothetical protein
MYGRQGRRSCSARSLAVWLSRVGRCVLPTRRDRHSDTILWTPLAQGKYSLEVCHRVRYRRFRFSCLLTILFKNELQLGVYLDAHDEELLALLTSACTHKPSSTTIKVEELNEESQSDGGQTEAGKRDYIVR